MVNGWESSAKPWTDFVDCGDANREHVLDPAMLSLAGDVSGARVLDVGCGEGRFCRLLSDRGARTVGLDPTVELLGEASGRHPAGEYTLGRAELLPFHDSSFDLVVSYVSLCDIADYRAAIAEMARVLSTDGRLLVAAHNPFVSSCMCAWHKDEQGNKLHIPVDNYVEESSTRAKWRGIDVVNYHRSMEAYMTAFLEAGLVLESFAEPLPSAESIQQVPWLGEYLRVPTFMTMAWRARGRR